MNHFILQKKERVYIGVSISFEIDDILIDFGRKIAAKKIISAKIKFVRINHQLKEIEEANLYIIKD